MTAVTERADVDAQSDEAVLLGTPVLHHDPIVFSGNPSAEEIAAVLIVFAAAGAAPAPMAPVDEEAWGAPSQMMRYGLSTAPTTFVNARCVR
ncbi:acyl-CoA carboxylase subunit epsilon [Rhodococcus pyridinivorans]|uniref:acyl-CoA carboxylase subunit epsilon n=1 Tax=Rhodococcus TaxID=1827 RepID=UPI001C7DD2CD|nr:acyl-CoA carboxylase subunit epsilon [Rhodococcus sp. DMU2021]MBX4171997.1 acyl-CoA carboxylase subunit epsilon [Rhodococcus sp. DMU2021]